MGTLDVFKIDKLLIRSPDATGAFARNLFHPRDANLAKTPGKPIYLLVGLKMPEQWPGDHLLYEQFLGGFSSYL